jgi:hypothetical protein
MCRCVACVCERMSRRGHPNHGGWPSRVSGEDGATARYFCESNGGNCIGLRRAGLNAPIDQHVQRLAIDLPSAESKLASADFGYAGFQLGHGRTHRQSLATYMAMEYGATTKTERSVIISVRSGGHGSATAHLISVCPPKSSWAQHSVCAMLVGR